MDKWNDWKSSDVMVYKLDKLESSALAVLYENSKRMCNESNNNVEVATVSPKSYFDEIADDILDNVSYVTRLPAFHMLSYKYPEVVSVAYTCEYERFESIEDLKKFFEKGKFATIILYSIVKYVDLILLKSYFIIRYKEVIDPQRVRDSKIDYITNES